MAQISRLRQLNLHMRQIESHMHNLEQDLDTQLMYVTAQALMSEDVKRDHNKGCDTKENL